MILSATRHAVTQAKEGKLVIRFLYKSDSNWMIE